MQTDRASLVELGLLPDMADGWPLGALFDRTHAPASHDALRRLLAAPLGSVADIEARQALWPTLHALARQVPWRDLHAHATQVERGLASNFIIAPLSRAAMLPFATSHRDIVAFAAEMAVVVQQFLALVRPVAARVAGMQGDPAFRALRDTFVTAVHDTRGALIDEAVRQGGRWRLATCDGLIRGNAAQSGAPDGVAYRDQLRAMIEACRQLDAWCALAHVSETLDGCLPQVVPRGGTLVLRGLRHPLLANGVANDVVFAARDRVCFLTGPNMAGKSTLLRTLGVAVVLAHLGLRVPAREAVVPCFDRLAVSLTVRDNLSRHESLYLAEVRRVKRVVEAVVQGEAVFAILDEVFRGTNVKDATQATALLVDGLAGAPHGLFVMASHLAEVGDTRTTAPGVACRRMHTVVDGEDYRFSYRLEDGVSDVHLGMRLLDAEGVGGMLRGLLGHN